MKEQPPQTSLPPGPRIPQLLQMLLMMYWPLKYLRYCGRKFGTLFTARGATHPPIVVLSDPGQIETAFRAGYDQLTAYPGNAIFLRLLGEESFIFQSGDRHRAGRKPLAPLVARNSSPDLPAMIFALAEDAMKRWPREKPLNVFHEFRRITYRSAMRRIIDFSDREDEDTICHAMDTYRGARLNGAMTLGFFNLGSPVHSKPLRFISGLWPKANRTAKLQRRMREMSGDEFDQRMAGPPREPGEEASYLDAVVTELRKNPAQWSRDEVLDNLNLLLVTGHESASVSSSWLVWELLQRPELLEQIRDEVDALPETITAPALKSSPTPLLDAAVLEGMRLHPPVPVASRSVREPLPIGDHLVPAGTTVLACMYLAHRSESLWDDPLLFRPERFLEGKPATGVYFPFGLGKYRCPGADMGILQIKCLLIALFRNLEFSFAGRRPPRELYAIAAIVPHNGVPLRVRTRQRPRPEPGAGRSSSESAACPYHAGAQVADDPPEAERCPVPHGAPSNRSPGQVPDQVA